jgi:type IV secretory pathway VirJ component
MKSLYSVITIIVILLISRPVFAEVGSGKRASNSSETRLSNPTATKPGLKTSPAEIPDLGTRETLDYEHFGTVAIYRKAPHPPHVVLFVSGDGGWEKSPIVMAKELREMNTLVVGISIKNYIPYLRGAHARCTFPAADLEQLSKYVQKTLDYPEYVPPILIGYSSGATLVYAALSEAPPNTFAGAISLGFCPDIQIRKPFCRGESLQYILKPGTKGMYFLPDSTLESPWIALQGTVDQVCDPNSTEDYAKQIPKAKVILLPKVGHGFALEKNYLPQFKEAYLELANVKTAAVGSTTAPKTGSANVNGLPIVQIPSAKPSSGDLFAVILSGDGGWASLDRQIGNELVKSGVPVVGFNTLQYFWKKRTPEESSQDLQRLLVHFLQDWKKQKVLIIGYSLGADVLPFMINRLPEDLQSKIQLLALLGPAKKAEFEFHLTDWVGSFGSDGEPTVPEIKKLKQKSICIYGDNEKDSACPDVQTKLTKVIPWRGGHHFDGDYQTLTKSILQEL